MADVRKEGGRLGGSEGGREEGMEGEKRKVVTVWE